MVAEDKLRIGNIPRVFSPIWPEALAIFPMDYVVFNNRKFPERQQNNPALPLGVELHQRTPQDLNRDTLEAIIAFHQEAKKSGIVEIQHMPFITLRRLNEETQGLCRDLDFNFYWHVVPAEYCGAIGSRNPVQAFNTPNGRVEWFADEMKEQDWMESIDLAKDLETKNLTFHTTKAGVYLSKEEWERYTGIVLKMKRYAVKVGYNGKIAVETGGGIRHNRWQAVGSELPELAKSVGIAINLDPAHLFLDLEHHGATVDEANNYIMQYFDINRELIEVIHLTQTNSGADMHKPLEEPGVLKACNTYIIKHLAEHHDSHNHQSMMVEARITEGTLDEISEEMGRPPKMSKQNAQMVIATIGLPESGKTTLLKAIISHYEGVEVLSTKRIRDEYNLQMIFDAYMELEDTQQVYTTMNVRLESKLRHSKSVIVDATHHLYHRQKTLASILKDCGVQNIYLIVTNCSKETAYSRIAENKRIYDENGGKMPPHLSDKIVKPEIYDMIMRDYKPVEPKMFGNEHDNKPRNVHVIYFNSDHNVITVQNNDATTNAIVCAIADYFKEMGTPIHLA